MSSQIPFSSGQGALFSDENGILYYGEGPFTSSCSPPSDENACAFYVNDYTLSDPLPWKAPKRLHIIPRTAPSQAYSLLSIGSGLGLDHTDFARIFEEISRLIRQGFLQKSVPVVSEFFPRTSTPTSPSDILERLQYPSLPLQAYGWWDESTGFAGASPERLLKKTGSLVETMALAGTASRDETKLFALDEKEIREHEFVARTLHAKLSDYGNVSRSPRQILELNSLIHFLTRLTVQLDAPTEINTLIRRLHPTPALGPLPRTDEMLRLLYSWREQLHCPPRFGAPFGFFYQGSFDCLVAIRGIHWDEKNFILSSGCGVISESRLTQEWNELKLKRQSILDNLGLTRNTLPKQ